MRRFVPGSRAPLALAGFLALPILFASLMAVSLAIEKPQVVEWTRPGGHLARVFHDPSATLEAKIWLLSFVPPLLLVLVGYLAGWLRYGIYVSCGAAVLEALALTARLGRWQSHHTARFPYGEDLLSDSTNSSLVSRGQWEQNAADTVHSLVRYAVGLALAAALIALYLELRHRRRPPAAAEASELQQTGGAPTASGA